MKKLLLLCCILLGITAVSRAQGGGRRSPEEQVAALKTSLALTDDQATKIKVILTAQTKTTDSLRAAGADRSAMMPVRTAATAKIKAVLTPDQAAEYDKQQAAMRQRGPGGAGGGGTPPPPPQR